MATWWIGLTGAIGSGKSQAAACFAELGVPVIDADAVNSAIITTPRHPALVRIHDIFGTEALNADGTLDRAYMRELVFRQPPAKMQLEKILHPYIIQDIQTAQRRADKHVYGIVEIPILAEQPAFQALVSRVIVVQCPQQERIKRVIQRSGLSEEAVLAIIANQADDETRLALAGDVIENLQGLAQLREAVKHLHSNYLNRLNG